MKLILFLLFASCSYKYNLSELIILNESKITFDSIKVHVNNYSLKIPEILSGKSRLITLDIDSVLAKHDVIYSFEFYVKDSMIVKNNLYLNDLGLIPKSLKIKITDSLTVERF